MIAAGTASATAGRKRQRARSQGAAPEEGLGFDPGEEADLFYDGPDGEVADPAAVQLKAQQLAALEEEEEELEAEEEGALTRQHEEERTRGVMTLHRMSDPRREAEEN